MAKSLIIKSSISKTPSGILKSNLGDLLRTSVILNEIKEDWIWVTDIKGKKILAFFLDHEKIITFDELDTKNIAINKYKNIYNLDNFLSDEKLPILFTNRVKGFIWKCGLCFPENNIIANIAPYISINNPKSWQQSCIEGLGFVWQEQDYPLLPGYSDCMYDIGFNYHVHPDWLSKQWSKKKWHDLYLLLQGNFSVSWQQGVDNLSQYINWLKNCQLIISCDSFGLHLASALRKHVIVISGPTNCKEYMYNRVFFITPENRDCMPCQQPKCKYNDTCINEIKPEEVYSYVLKIMTRLG